MNIRTEAVPYYPQPQATRDCLAEYRRSNEKHTAESIWSQFDRIFLIHYVGYEDRLKAVKSELQRVGIWGRKNFRLKEMVRTEQEKKIPNCAATDGERNLTIGHGEIYAEAKEMQYKRVLVFEDDVRFLKDENLLFYIMARVPAAGIVNLDPLPILSIENLNKLYSQSENGFVLNDSLGVWGTSAYVLNGDSIDYLFNQMRGHTKTPVADYWARETPMTRYIAAINICCQEQLPECIGNERKANSPIGANMTYKLIGMDYDLYNISEQYAQKIKETRTEYLPVVIVGKDRGKMTCAVVQSVLEHVTGATVKIIISTDRSSTLSEGIVRRFMEKEHIDYEYLKTDNQKYGLGAALQNGLDKAELYSDCVLVLENDMLVRGDIDAVRYVDLLRNSDAAFLNFKPASNLDSEEYEYNGHNYLVRIERKNTMFSDPICFGAFMIHRRLISELSFLQCCPSIDAEHAFISAYKSRSMEEWRNRKMLSVQDAKMWYSELNAPESPVIHIGYTGEHEWGKCPEEYRSLQNDAYDASGQESERKFYKDHKVLFATNGLFGSDSIFATAINNVMPLCGEDIYICPNNKYGKSAFLDIFEYAIQKDYDYIVYFDCDCFVTSARNLHSAFALHLAKDACVSGVSDGGVIGHRSGNPWAINPFLMFVTVSKIKDYRTSSGWQFNDKRQFAGYDNSGWAGISWNRSKSAYDQFRRRVAGYRVPYLEKPECADKWTCNIGNLDAEPYYDIFLGLKNDPNTVNFFIGRDYPCAEDPDGIVSALYWFGADEEIDLNDDSRIICLHTWYARTAHWDAENYKRISRISQKAAHMMGLEQDVVI